ncbi:MAG: CsbD family protein [Coxiellaceae bacterium]|nr:MAG: CsbD family protein [Coxiellaceae bacterium]
MNRDAIMGHWKEMNGKLQAQWGKITKDDLAQMRGTFEELAGVIQQKYGYTREQAERELRSFIHNQGWDMEAETLLNRVKDELRAHSKEVGNVVTHYVREKPFTALGIAALVGAGIAFLLRR